MERPDIILPPSGGDYRLVARAQSAEEADNVAESYRMQGYKIKIVRRSQAGIPIFEVWASKRPDILSAR